MTDLERAVALLHEGDHSVVLVRGDDVLVSDDRGVAPLVGWVDSGDDLSGFSAADRVVGRAAALLYVLLGVEAVHGDVMARGAMDVLSAHGITASHGTLAEQIVNRAGTGPCPMEAATAGIDEPSEALRAIKAKQAELRAHTRG